LKISAVIIDGILTDTRKRYRIKGRSATKPGTLLKKSILIRIFADWDEKVSGFLEVDMRFAKAHNYSYNYKEFM